MIPLCFQPLASLVQHCVRSKTSLFSNGAGKQLLSILLNLCYCVGKKDWIVKVSTTQDSRHDWCGICPRKGDPNVCGVPDICVQTLGGTFLVIGEVKSELKTESAESQLLAAIQVAQRQQSEKILGLRLLPALITLYVPSMGKGAVLSYSCFSRSVDDFRMVLEVIYKTLAYAAKFSYKETDRVVILSHRGQLQSTKKCARG